MRLCTCIPSRVHGILRLWFSRPHNAAGFEHVGCGHVEGAVLWQQQQLLSKDILLSHKDEQLLSRDHEIEHLKLLIAKLRRMQFGRKSEKVERQIEQLELQLEDLEANRAESVPPTEKQPALHRTRFHRQPSHRDVRFPIIFRARPRPMSPRTSLP